MTKPTWSQESRLSWAKGYYTHREQKLREVGLDPDDDEDWARPDYELDEVPLGEQVQRDDGWFFGAQPEPYDSTLQAWCRDCYEVDAAPNDILCPLCRFDHDRKVA